MRAKSIINKIEDSGLVGRGGASFPTALKWQAVKRHLIGHNSGYIIVNAAEGEPGVKKDEFLLRNKTEEVLDGVNLAFSFLGKRKVKKIYFYIKESYYKNYKAKILKIINSNQKYSSLNKKLEFFIKPSNPSYIAGEESAIVNIISNKRAEPSIRPPFPSEKGLFDFPTLINNVETFYSVSLISKNEYHADKLYTISGAVKHKGVFSLSADMSAEEVLRSTDNYPDFDFFAILGGGVCGEVLDKKQLMAPVEGSGLIMVYDKNKTDKNKLLDYWLRYYEKESCGLCTSCREGTYRLREMLKNNNHEEEEFVELLDNLKYTSFCSLGSSLPLTIKSFLKNIYK